MKHMFGVESIVHGYHEYQDVWDAPVHEVLSCKREVGNVYDTYAVAIKKNGEIVGHCLRKTSAICSIFIRLVAKSHAKWQAGDDIHQICHREA